MTTINQGKGGAFRERTISEQGLDGERGDYRPCMTFERDTERPSNRRSRPVTSNNIIRRKKLFPLRRNRTNRHPLLILFQSSKPMTPFNLKRFQFLRMFKDNRSQVILTHICRNEIVFKIAFGEFGDFHGGQDFVVSGIGGTEPDSFGVGEGIVDYVVEDTDFIHLVQDNGEVTMQS